MNGSISRSFDAAFTDYSRANRVAKVSLFLAVGVCTLAAVLTWAASVDAGTRSFAEALVDALSIVPAGRWSDAASYPQLASVYYLCVSPLVVIGLVGTLAKLGYPIAYRKPPDGQWNHRLRALMGSVFCGALGTSFLFLFDGSNIRWLRVGTDFAALLVFGWIPFYVCGALAALSLLALHAAVFPFRSAFMRADDSRN